MASNRFGTLFTITTWGESHGKAIGVVIDGCPAGLALDENEINQALALRAPGKTPWTSPRKEPDQAQLLSGVFEGVTTGAPISIIIFNQDARSSHYEPIKDLLRPGHANYTYLQKYGVFDHCGGGRASARETACRVAAGAVAKKLLQHFDIDILAFLTQVGDVEANFDEMADLTTIRKSTQEGRLCCPDVLSAEKMIEIIEMAQAQGDSLGGTVTFITSPLVVGLGDPIYEKLEANLAKAMLSLPATKAFEIGSGMRCVSMCGSQHNDRFYLDDESVKTETNYAGGTLGGISTGMPLIGRTAFKPASSIKKTQSTLSIQGESASLTLPEGSRHDPCIAIRAVPVVEAMVALVLADALLLNRSARL